MGALDPRLERRLARVRGGQRWAAVGGGVAALLGAAYVAWGVASFHPRADPRKNPGFDWPVAQVAFLYDQHQTRLTEQTFELPRERFLAQGLYRTLNFNAGLLLLATRVLIGTIACLGGLAAMTVAVERGRLLAIIDALQGDDAPER